MFPDASVQPLVGYGKWNQSTLGITRYIIGRALIRVFPLSEFGLVD